RRSAAARRLFRFATAGGMTRGCGRPHSHSRRTWSYFCNNFVMARAAAPPHALSPTRNQAVCVAPAPVRARDTGGGSESNVRNNPVQRGARAWASDNNRSQWNEDFLERYARAKRRLTSSSRSALRSPIATRIARRAQRAFSVTG